MIFEAPRSENPRRTTSYDEGLSDAGNEEDRNIHQALLCKRYPPFETYSCNKAEAVERCEREEKRHRPPRFFLPQLSPPFPRYIAKKTNWDEYDPQKNIDEALDEHHGTLIRIEWRDQYAVVDCGVRRFLRIQAERKVVGAYPPVSL